jgi:hypothetical protein
MVKVITFFLIGMVILALFGRLRIPKVMTRETKPLTAARCKRCGKPLIGKGPCDCGGKA